MALRAQGDLGGAIAAYRRLLDLLPPHDPSRKAVTQQLRECQRWLELDQRLPALLQGQAKPADANERLVLAELCQQQHKRLYAAAARFYAEAFAEQPRLAEDLQAGHRYNAACAAALAAAALAAAGQGRDAAGPGDAERLALRRRALTWLRADLAARARQMGSWRPGAPAEAQRALRHWRQDPDLGGLRDKAELVKLPEAERRACRDLWAAVDELLRRAQPKPGQP
jgi:hypothetical protein